MNKWSVTSLTILIGIIIGFLWLTSQQSYGAVTVPFLSGVLGFLLKSLNDAITISQRRKWDLDDIASERTLNYYESKLSEMSLFVVDELMYLATLKSYPEGKNLRIHTDNRQITKEWLSSSASPRTFLQAIGDSEIVDAYTNTTNQLARLNNFISDLNLGKFDTHEHAKIKTRLQDKMTKYMENLKDFQLAIELVRLKVLRGELSLNKKDS